MCLACDTANTVFMLPFKQPLALLLIRMAALVSDKDACGAGLEWGATSPHIQSVQSLNHAPLTATAQPHAGQGKRSVRS